jgi:1,2-diacylglycerol 3-beta-galactosyltransferase
MSARPRLWRFFYYLSNNKLNEVWSNNHSRIMCGAAIKKRIKSFDPDVVVSVHPTMNHVPLRATRNISRELGKHIPFFTVVTDLGSAHIMWFEKKVNKLYVASERLYNIARRNKGTPKENIVLTGLPIRHGFAVQAEKLGDRTSEQGKEYQKKIKMELGIDSDKPMVLVMGGGEGVGYLSEIVDQLYLKLALQGVDATICVVCGRNEKLKESLATRDWDSLLQDAEAKPTKRHRLLRFFKRRKSNKQIAESVKLEEEQEAKSEPHSRGTVDVVGLGFITSMPEYMAAADVLVSKAGPGTIAEAASVGLPVMLTR